MSIVITSFYKFFKIDNLSEIKSSLLEFCIYNNVKGTILIANEGINSTIASERKSIDLFYKFIKDLFEQEFTYKESFDCNIPFAKMKIKIKSEIVTIGIDVDVDNNKGRYVNTNDWDEFISREDVMIIDTRNKYEVSLGSFSKAIDPKIDNFRQFPKWANDNREIFRDKKIAMFCTGGIRCEKSTAFMKESGWDDVYHLRGGIIQYLNDTKNINRKWNGNCFVFDERAMIDDNLSSIGDINCHLCLKTITTNDIKRTGGYIDHKPICPECC